MSEKKTAVERFDEGFIQEVIEAVRNNTAPWQKSWQTGQLSAPHNAFSKHIYSGRNAVRLAIVADKMGYTDPRWATARQIREAGGLVQKGEKGTGILFYREKKVIDDEGKPKSIPIASYWHVYNITQTTLPLSLPELRNTSPDLPAFAELLGYHNPRILPGEPAYRPANDTIYLPDKSQFANDAEYYATALHEMAHWTGHPDRLNRLINIGNKQDYAHEELVAELSSWMLSLEYGLPFTPTQSQAYLQYWAAKTGTPLEDSLLAGFKDAVGAKNYLDAPLRERTSVRSASHEEYRAANASPTEKILVPTPQVQTTPDRNSDTTSPAAAAKSKNVEKPHDFMSTFRKETDPAAEQHRVTQNLANRPVWLAVPYEDRHAAKQAGAQWSQDKKCWFAADMSVTPDLGRWQRSAAEFSGATGGKTIDDLRATARSLGLAVDHGFDTRPGVWHRIPLDGRGSHNKDGAYKIFENADGSIGAIVKNLSTDEKIHWSNRGAHGAKIPREVLHAEELNRAERIAAQEQVRMEIQAERAKEALAAYKALDNAHGDEPYVTRKQMANTHGIKSLPDGTLVVPLINGERVGLFETAREHFGVVSLQTIAPNGDKRLMSGAQKQGAYFPIGDGAARISPTHVIIAEGVATADAAHQILSGGNRRVLAIAAVDVGNLAAVAEKIADMYPQAQKIIAADNDIATQIKHGRNPGLDAANALAAKYPDFAVAVPEPTTEGKSTDWNDVLVARGKGAAVTAFAKQLGITPKKPDILLPDLANLTCARDAGIRAYDSLQGDMSRLPHIKQALAKQGFVLDETRLRGIAGHPAAQRDAFAKAVRKAANPPHLAQSFTTKRTIKNDYSR